MSQDQFQSAIAAYAQVKQTVDALKTEHAEVVAEIATVETELQVLPLGYLPVDDLKAGVLDLIDAAGDRYSKQIRGAICDFATGKMSGSLDALAFQAKRGKPITYADLEAAISGCDPEAGRAQLLSPNKRIFHDEVLYFFFAAALKERLREIMDGITPEELGYPSIRPADIGSPREERRRAIADLDSRLGKLKGRKAEIEQKLAAIGSPLPSGERKGNK